MMSRKHQGNVYSKACKVLTSYMRMYAASDPDVRKAFMEYVTEYVKYLKDIDKSLRSENK